MVRGLLCLSCRLIYYGASCHLSVCVYCFLISDAKGTADILLILFIFSHPIYCFCRLAHILHYD